MLTAPADGGRGGQHHLHVHKRVRAVQQPIRGYVPASGFLPQVALAIATSLLGAGLARRISTKRVYLLGLACSTVAMVLLLASTLVKSNQAAAYPLLLVATAFLGAGFGLTVPVLNTYTSVFNPDSVDRSVLVLNALLGLGTALAPVLVAIFVGLGFWRGLPIVSTVLLVGLLVVSVRLPLRAGARAGAVPHRHRPGRVRDRAPYRLAGVLLRHPVRGRDGHRRAVLGDQLRDR
jgi:MFS family permease